MLSLKYRITFRIQFSCVYIVYSCLILSFYIYKKMFIVHYSAGALYHFISQELNWPEDQKRCIVFTTDSKKDEIDPLFWAFHTLQRGWKQDSPWGPGLGGFRPINALDDVTKGSEWQTFKAVQKAWKTHSHRDGRKIQDVQNLKWTIIIQESFICMWYSRFAGTVSLFRVSCLFLPVSVYCPETYRPTEMWTRWDWAAKSSDVSLKQGFIGVWQHRLPAFTSPVASLCNKTSTISCCFSTCLLFSPTLVFLDHNQHHLMQVSQIKL